MLMGIFILCITASAQQLTNIPGTPGIKPAKPGFRRQMETAQKVQHPFIAKQNDQRQLPPDNMPVTAYGKNGERFLYNNGNGTDVYAAALDNMRVAKPDASFHSAMPTGKEQYRLQQVPSEQHDKKSRLNQESDPK